MVELSKKWCVWSAADRVTGRGRSVPGKGGRDAVEPVFLQRARIAPIEAARSNRLLRSATAMKKTSKRRHATTQIGVGLSVALALTMAARMLAATAIPGSEFRVNTSTAGWQGTPAVAMDGT